MKKISIVAVTLFIASMICSCSNSTSKEEKPMQSGTIVESVGPITVKVNMDAYSQLVYVDASVETSGNGEKDAPFKTIGEALLKIKEAGENSRAAVLVAAGTYQEPTIEAKPWVDLFGGFDPRNWQRDVRAHKTTLLGTEGDRIMVGADHCVIDGFNFLKALFRGKGAALYCDKVSPVISNNSFVMNKTQGPKDWNPKYWHETANDGGAVYCSNGSDAVIKNNLFAGNKTECGRGAALACDYKCNTVVSNNVFIENTAGLNDSMRSSDAGAVSIFDRCNVTVNHNYFLSNKALARNDGGGIFVAFWSSATIYQNVFVDNEAADDAGAIFVGGQEHRYDGPLDPLPPKDEFYVTIDGNTVIGNRNASMNSGAMRFTMEARGEFTNNITAFNNGIYFQRSEVAVSHNIILDNFLFIETKEGLKPGSITDNIIWGKYDQQVKATVSGNLLRDKTDKFLQFVNDGERLNVISTTIDKDAYYTEILTSGLNYGTNELIGRIVKADDQWGIVKSNEQGTVTVWGDFSNVSKLTVLPTYTIAN